MRAADVAPMVDALAAAADEDPAFAGAPGGERAPRPDAEVGSRAAALLMRRPWDPYWRVARSCASVGGFCQSGGVDLSYTAEEEQFRAELRTWLADNIPDEWTRARLLGVASTTTSRFRLRRDWEARQDRRRLLRHRVADRVRRPRRHAGHEGHLRRGDGAAPARRRPSTSLGLTFLAPTIMAIGTPGAAGRDHRADAAQRGDLVPGLLRARRRLRPRGGGHPRRPRRRRLRGQRPEDLDHERHARRQDLHDRPHRAGLRAAQGPVDAAHRHGPARRRGPPAQADERGQRVRRGVLHRRPRARRRTASARSAHGWRTAMLLLSFERGASGVGQYTEFRRQYDEIVEQARALRPRRRPGGPPEAGARAWSSWSACATTRCTSSPRSSRAGTSAPSRR